MLLNNWKILNFALCLSSVYGWSYPRYITDEYENGNRLNRISSYINDNINCQYPSYDSRCRHQTFRSNNFDKNSDDNRSSEEHYKQIIPELLKEIKSHIIKLSASRCQSVLTPVPVFYLQKNADGDLPNPTNKSEIVKKYPNEGNKNQNWKLRLSDDFDPNRIWGTHIKEDDNKGDTKNTQCNCEKAEDKAATSTFRQKYSVDTSTRCRAAALYCCISANTKQQQEYCFESQGCLDSYKMGACLPAVIRAIYAELYKDILN